MEIWTDVIGYKGIYQVSNMGRVKSLKSGKHRHGHILKPVKRPDGYLQVNLRRDGKTKHMLVHRLVADAFLGPRPSPDHEVNHRNGNKADNCVENLEWVSHQENCEHAYRLLDIDMHSGEANGNAKLTRHRVKRIRKMNAVGKHTQAEIGRIFGVSQTTISDIVNRKLWSHVL